MAPWAHQHGGTTCPSRYRPTSQSTHGSMPPSASRAGPPPRRRPCPSCHQFRGEPVVVFITSLGITVDESWRAVASNSRVMVVGLEPSTDLDGVEADVVAD